MAKSIEFVVGGLRQALRMLSATAGMLLLLFACLVPFIPTLIAVAVGGSELYHMAETGLPHSVKSLHWTEWQESDGQVTSTEWAPEPGRLIDTKIVAYRVGQASDVFSKFTLYQARYILANGEEVVAPARGPVGLTTGIAVTMVLLIAAASPLLYFGSRQTTTQSQGPASSVSST